MSDISERNVAFLAEMGLAPLWERRASALVAAEPVTQQVEKPAASGAVSSAWTTTEPVMPAMSKVAVMPPRAIAQMNWTELKSAVAGCTRCGLCDGRTQTIFGAGDERAKWLFIGEAPRRDRKSVV